MNYEQNVKHAIRIDLSTPVWNDCWQHTEII